MRFGTVFIHREEALNIVLSPPDSAATDVCVKLVGSTALKTLHLGLVKSHAFREDDGINHLTVVTRTPCLTRRNERGFQMLGEHVESLFTQ